LGTEGGRAAGRWLGEEFRGGDARTMGTREVNGVSRRGREDYIILIHGNYIFTGVSRRGREDYII
jgi:hypothetical protein